ncbi:unnamed protein product [Periconia digitata]|uniref:Glycoside hydrolase family 5 protein n=1 Tax=Periconia digitata TaxID=1303443 RepID=A0A9W4XHA8_9PLEO|nr:unnamed protein product [Periconia digitata]
MFWKNALLSLASIAWVAGCAASNLRITEDLFSFGGVNFPQLQYLAPSYRDKIIRKVVESNARVIRLFIKGDAQHSDPEPTLGEFDKDMLDRIDDTLAQIYHISKGTVKVIIVPHDAHSLRGTDDSPCDAYCKELEGYFLDFYSVEKYRDLYKTRLEVLFNHYPSRNFGGRSWSELSEVIMGVDVQNQPWANIHPIVAGEAWLCIMATYLKDTLGLGKSNIAVITGGISGPQSLTRNQNFPDSALDCPAVDIIGIHGYFAQKEDFTATAGTPWAQLLLPGNTLTARAHKQNKLLLVEEWSYQNTPLGLTYKKQAIFDQANALNHRGIPWLYSHITFLDNEGTTSQISIERDPDIAAIGALQNALTRAATSRSYFNWTTYMDAPPPSLLSNHTLIPMNPYIPDRSSCLIGCEGFLCDSADSCAPSLMCKNSICQVPSESQPGKIADSCNSKKPCLSHLRCGKDGTCQECRARATIPPEDFRRKVVFNNPHGKFGQCELDIKDPFNELEICVAPPASPYIPSSSSATQEEVEKALEKYPSNPCTNPTHCSANEYCSWGSCVPCSSLPPSSSPSSPFVEGCLGSPCTSSQRCKTGLCSVHGTCDYPAKPRKLSTGGKQYDTWKSRKGAGYGKGKGSGPNKVWDVPVRVKIPEEEVKATGTA